jgi:ATP-grasp domain/L-amino acid ligase C-terminal domain 2/ATP-grasp N-terminal domain
VRRVLLLATTTGYQTRAFGEAADALGVQLTYATDRCHMLDDPWRDEAIPIRFHDEPASVEAILAASRIRPIHGVVAVGDRPTVIAALVARALGLPAQPPEAVAIARDKQRTRERLRAAGEPVPWFHASRIDVDPRDLITRISFPCVIKPVALSASRGVMRADDPETFHAAFDRLRALLAQPDIRAERNDAHDRILVEGFIPGREFALEGLLHHGALEVLALFDKPDPLDGPFFEETIYVTPSVQPEPVQAQIRDAVARAASVIGLLHGPIHAECRVNNEGVFVLEVAARPIGGLCARALRFRPRAEEGLDRSRDASGPLISLEELLLRHVLGEGPDRWCREARASGVMMIPIPCRGVYRGASGVDEAQATDGVDEVAVTAKIDQRLVPLPEGASYLGFIFAHGESAALVDRSLRRAHSRLRFRVEPELRMLANGVDAVH